MINKTLIASMLTATTVSVFAEPSFLARITGDQALVKRNEPVNPAYNTAATGYPENGSFERILLVRDSGKQPRHTAMAGENISDFQRNMLKSAVSEPQHAPSGPAEESAVFARFTLTGEEYSRLTPTGNTQDAYRQKYTHISPAQEEVLAR